jgi:hypothetical protein
MFDGFMGWNNPFIAGVDHSTRSGHVAEYILATRPKVVVMETGADDYHSAEVVSITVDSLFTNVSTQRGIGIVDWLNELWIGSTT